MPIAFCNEWESLNCQWIESYEINLGSCVKNDYFQNNRNCYTKQNTRWKLIPSYFVIQACWTKWKQLPRSLVCMRTSVDVMYIFIQGRAGSWQLWLVNVCEHCWPEHLSQQRCGAAAFCFCRVACLTFQQLLFSDSSWQPSLSHFHIHSYHFLQLVDLICESESRFSVHRVLF